VQVDSIGVRHLIHVQSATTTMCPLWWQDQRFSKALWYLLIYYTNIM